ncbi:ArsR/SmtB family transcription factor [Streptomyces silvisoli]|uniref:Metalloregulator ArsR/SmtB family transcription factor n=1 Tax=Streptomyces silvisoli TaxID=3034235 RepID=A0ABT5ZPU5_9ACTN|nr:metalloregulator ArsR/SmtB family transcription factor [Streptomyces silvisoli]MDF3291746.1 metalloregulator ArsR/SmtB family transcription factor [Streptomyces silvisoli]
MHLAAATFALLSSPMRLHIVWALAQRENDVSQPARRLGGTPQAVSQHLAKLKLAGVVQARGRARLSVYRAVDPHLVTAATLMLERLTQDVAPATLGA